MTTQDDIPPAPTRPRRAPYEPVTLSEEKLAELEEEHEDVLVIRGSEKAPWLVVLRRPKREEAILFKQAAKRDSTTANEQFVRRICVYPKPGDEAFEKQVRRWALMTDGIAISPGFQEFLGITIENDLK